MKPTPFLLAVTGCALGIHACGNDQQREVVVAGTESPEDMATGGGETGGSSPTSEYEGIALPATFEAEHFVRAFESDVLQEGDEACTSPVNPYVDIGASEVASGGCSIGYATGGEWIEFDIAVNEAGGYDFVLALASQLSDRTVSISIDGMHRGTIALPATDWLEFEELSLEGVGLTEGSHNFRITFDTGATNLDYIRIDAASSCQPACENKTCGEDFCGGVCGTCDSDQTCSSADQCIGPFVKPVVEHGQLSVTQGQIVDESGEPYQLRGVSTQWLNWDQIYAGNADAMLFMRDSWGLEVYRVANGVENTNGYADPDVREERMERVKDIIESAIELDIYVLVDWHTHEIEHKDLAIEFFSEIAEEYGDEPNVIYEVFNEPIGDSDDLDGFWTNELKPYHEELVAAIREHDPDNLIVLGTPRWDQAVDIAAKDPVDGENLLYALHFYSCTHTSWLRARAEDALESGIALFVTEWGSTHADGGTAANPGVCLSEARAWHDFLDENGISSTAWKLVSDNDASAILLPSPPSGPWADEQLTEHGTFVREVIQR